MAQALGKTDAKEPMDFITALTALQEACGVAEVKRFELLHRQSRPISTGCLWNGAIDRYLEGHPQIKRLVFAVDNDYLARDKNGQLRNWGQLTAAKWMKAYTEKGYACAVHVPHLNDFNTDLVEMRKGRSVEDLDRQRMAELETAFEQSAEEEPEQGMEV